MQSILSIFGNISVFDAVLIFFIAGFTVYGFFKGIIRMAGELVGYLVGIYLAGHYFELFYEWTRSLYLGYENIGRLVSFLILLFIVRKLVTLGVYLIDRFFDIIAIIPFFGLINRFAGAVFGFLSVSIVLGIVIYFASRYSIGFSIDKFLVGSSIAKFLLHFGEFVSPLLPGLLRNLHSLL
ncbi:hypothetical protein A2477_00615 [Candidatus Falkowbacteria bacterium RIFOXYC2_FULL_47_12]|uniref:Colicin V production protein n=2 Tax=Candidatus Falkowiibacteriota TaxID=1752728 RepID=A0A1F5TLZ2_9BACT|nr:MAG: hypothetical protein A2242_00330 [Candidatus Falkowbacteria bacterium RIFOXYA2_FULL_47_9]OGF39869.1 MAG: hypothetical protein A2477_00615 [Candidatus Falkowbacteria bacterium RIFOXYC2_FULL_47_12]